MAGEAQWEDVCAAPGACALAGATAFFAGIPGSAVVVNGPLWCSFYARRYTGRPCFDLEQRFYCTQPDNACVVYGTEACLRETLALVRQKPLPAVLCIVNSCSIGLIGDDIAGIAAGEDFSCPVVCFDSGGLGGGFWTGYRAAAEAYFDALPLQPRRTVLPHSVNLIGASVSYWNAESDLAEIKRMLREGGFRVLACPGAGSGPEEIAAMSAAECNIVLHPELGLPLAQQLRQRCGIPYIAPPLPYGLSGARRWLAAAGDTAGRNRAGFSLLQQECDYLERRMEEGGREMRQLWGDLSFPQAAVCAPSSVALALAEALDDWADIDRRTLVFHDKPQEEPDDSLPWPVAQGEESKALLQALSGGLLLGSSQERALLHQFGVRDAVCLNVATPVHDELRIAAQPFMGFQGAAVLAERLWNGAVAMRCNESLTAARALAQKQEAAHA